MGWERRALLDQETQGSDSATRRKSLPRSGLLSGIELRVSCTNGATNGTEFILDALDKVEVVADGSNVLFSLEGPELFAWAQVNLRRMPPMVWTEALSVAQHLTLPVLFGRYLGDPEFSLDLSAYRDVELRVTFSPTIAATAFTTATFVIHAVMVISDDVSPPGPRQGWLRLTQVYAFTSVASGEEVIELARLNPYWDILVYAREAGIVDGTDITIVEVRANDKRMIPFTGRWDDIQRANQMDLDLDPTIYMQALRTAADTLAVRTGRVLAATVAARFTYAADTDFPLYTVRSIAGDVITIDGQLNEGSGTWAGVDPDTTDRTLDVMARGMGIGNAVLLPFATRHGHPDFALPAPSYSRLQLALTNGGAGAAVKVSTRELVLS